MTKKAVKTRAAFTLPVEAVNRLDEVADRLGVTKSVVLTLLINEKWSLLNPTNEKEPVEEKAPVAQKAPAVRNAGTKKEPAGEYNSVDDLLQFDDDMVDFGDDGADEDEGIY